MRLVIRVSPGEVAMSTVADSRHALNNIPIALERPLHFATPDGSDIEVHAGHYRVDVNPSGHIELNSPESLRGNGVPLRTDGAWHHFTIEAPVALKVAGTDHAQYIVVLLPGGATLQATGSP